MFNPPVPVFRAHEVRVNIVDVGLAAIPVTIIPVAPSSTTGVESPCHGVLVALVCVVLGAPADKHKHLGQRKVRYKKSKSKNVCT